MARVVLWRTVEGEPPKPAYPLEVLRAQIYPANRKQPSTSLRNVYYFYTETPCKTVT